MAKDLRSFLGELESNAPDELMRVKREVDLRYETSAVAERLGQEGRYPALLFEKVKGFNIPVVTNLFARRSRLAFALRTTEADLNRVYREREDKLVKPVLVEDGPVKEVVIKGSDVDLSRLPIPLHNEKDGAPYITCGAMVVKDPETGIRNVGIYRHMVEGRNKVGIHLAETSHATLIYEKWAQRGKAMPVAITIGHHPAFFLGVLSFLPFGVDEYEVVGALMEEPLELVKCETVDLEVPAYAEIVLEGEIDPTERAREGPIGEYTTLYGAPRDNPVVTINAILMRKNPIFLDVVNGHPDHQLLGGIGRLSFIYKMVRAACPTVKDVFMPPSGCCRLTCYVSIKKRHEGEAQNVAAAVFAADPFVKYVVVVDDDVDIFNDSAVLRAIATRLHADGGAFMVRNAKGHPLDPTARNEFLVTKVGIDATKPLKGFPETVRVPGSDTLDLSKYLS
ncbi:MAG: UbiD family decarboxylase [Firmicutes bacterium]|nr:UbiD family decarboxylase [Bacillota bacterium]